MYHSDFVSRKTYGGRKPCNFTGSLWDDCEATGFLFDVHMYQCFEREKYTRLPFSRWDGAVTGSLVVRDRSELSQSQQDDRFNGRFKRRVGQGDRSQAHG